MLTVILCVLVQSYWSLCSFNTASLFTVDNILAMVVHTILYSHSFYFVLVKPYFLDTILILAVS